MKYHLIGIKGSGMASLATILKDRGFEVTGSDIDKYIFTQDALEKRNIPFSTFSKDNIKPGMNVIVGLSFDESNEEVYEAYHRDDVSVYRYNEYIGAMMEDYVSISVAGTHGKTTTTGMLAHVLSYHDTTGFLIGDGTGDMPEGSNFFVLESCEYKRHFLSYHPDYAIVTNMELDHIDYYKDMNDYVKAFEEFVSQIKKGAVLFGDDPYVRALKPKCKTLYYGLEDGNDIQAKNIIENTSGMQFDVYLHGEFVHQFKLPIYGKPLLWDTLAVIGVAYLEGMSFDLMEEALHTFGGVKRRFSVEEVGENVYIDDYAHHPTAIMYLIEAVRTRYPNHKLVAIFKPDRYSRIEGFLDRFAESLSTADKVYLCDFPLNAVREEGVTVTIDDLISRISNVTLLSEDIEGAKILEKEEPAVYLFMSSKDIYKLKDHLKHLQEG